MSFSGQRGPLLIKNIMKCQNIQSNFSGNVTTAKKIIIGVQPSFNLTVIDKQMMASQSVIFLSRRTYFTIFATDTRILIGKKIVYKS